MFHGWFKLLLTISYPEESTVLVTKVEELNHIRASQRESGLLLVLEDGESSKGEVDECLEFGGLEAPP